MSAPPQPATSSTRPPEAQTPEIFLNIVQELREGLTLYWAKAARMLDNSDIAVIEPGPEYYDLKNHFFSALFQYSFYRGGLRPERRVFYAAIDQCLRGMVTGCDNLLDDEYKQTLDTTLPREGTRFRSVLDIMVSDRILYEILFDGVDRGEWSGDLALQAGRASLRALLKSGAQEASEEAGIESRLAPEAVLENVHDLKTGVLFQCPWAVPAVLEDIDEGLAAEISTALYKIGMGCQVLDDMADLSLDVRTNHHNYVASLIHHGSVGDERKRLEEYERATNTSEMDDDLLWNFPEARRVACRRALNFLHEGLGALFQAEHESFVEPAIRLIADRIGVTRYLDDLSEKP